MQRETIKPLRDKEQSARRRLTFKGEIALAVLPTATILAVLALLEIYSRQRLLFASLASSAFLIYLDPKHETNSIRTLIVSQMAGALIGSAALWLFGAGYLSAAIALVVTILIMILLDAMHPPAVSTALTFAFRPSSESSLALFALAVGAVTILIVLQRFSLWLLERNSLKVQKPQT